MAKIFQCNCCSKQEQDLNTFIEISSSNNSISIKNNASGNNSRELSNYDNLHFCSQVCLNEYLFKPLRQREVLLESLKSEMKSVIYKCHETDSNEAFLKTIKLIEDALTRQEMRYYAQHK